jgi:carboxymethylenebutenolidase
MDAFERLRTMPEPVHPGEYISEELLPNFELTVEQMAKRLDVSSEYLDDVIKGRASITPIVAIGLSRIDQSDPLLWMDLQTVYDVWHAYRKTGLIPGAVTDPSRVQGEAIQFKSGGDTIQGYFARPSQAGRNPGIVVIHEAFGLVEHIRDIARRFANIGYNALAPDLYTRAGGPKDPNDINTVFPVMFGLPDAQAVRDLEAASAHLRNLPGATAKIGAIGFCSGGRQTLLFACSSDKVDAAIDCWGGFISRATPDEVTTSARPTPVIDMIDRLKCPLFAAFGEEDQNPSVAESEELLRLAQRAGKDVTVKVYKNAGHAFLADYRPSYREQAAAELWRDAVSFFDKHLKS